ncbi:MAG: archaemetzincin family Zn-dependent metalloprotease [Candidatus Caldarchaeum sp.]|nr:archaemetzincin family Zn-dependent metalloprotease [Candidatus Caldarchaeum sp.]
MNEFPDQSIAKAAAEKISQVYGVETSMVNTKIDNFEHYYDKKRRQYDVVALLSHIKPEENYLLLLTDRDIFVPGLNFVFGYAPGRVAVVSVYRLDPLRTEGRVDDQLLRRRVVKEAVHEVGHMLGLRHCSTPGCVMNFSNSVWDVDLKGETPCEKCMKKVIFSQG